MLYAVLTLAMQSRGLKASTMRYAQTENGHAAYTHVSDILETEFYGSGGLSTCINNINSRTFLNKQDQRHF